MAHKGSGGVRGEVHATLGMAPDMYVLGRMRTPALRAEHERTTATLSHLLTGPNALVPGLESYSDALARPTMAQQTRVTEFNAACVALHLETLDTPPFAGTLRDSENSDVEQVENVWQ